MMTLSKSKQPLVRTMPFSGQLLMLLLAGSLCYPTASAADQAANRGRDANEIVLTAGSPQLTSLKVEAVSEIPVPVTEPLNGKIVFDENRTARIFSPVAGRALTIKAQVGDSVKAGQTLLVMDSPDVGGAVADARKAAA